MGELGLVGSWDELVKSFFFVFAEHVAPSIYNQLKLREIYRFML